MEEQALVLILSIVGAFGTIALSINAFFLKGIYDDLGAVKLKMIEIYTEQKNDKKETEEIKITISNLKKKVHELSGEVQKIKMAQGANK